MVEIHSLNAYDAASSGVKLTKEQVSQTGEKPWFNASQTAGQNQVGDVSTFSYEAPPVSEVGANEFDMSSISQYFDSTRLTAAIASNPNIKKILDEHNIELNINMTELDNLKKGHLQDAVNNITKIYESLPDNLKASIDLKTLQTAAAVHDFGKILIPDSILNKPGRYTDEEREIMKLHSELGYEIMRSLGADDAVLSLIRYHHQFPDGSGNGQGYPKTHEDFAWTPELELLVATDVYSALREQRVYKSAYSKEKTLEIMHENYRYSEEELQAKIGTPKYTDEQLDYMVRKGKCTAEDAEKMKTEVYTEADLPKLRSAGKFSKEVLEAIANMPDELSNQDTAFAGPAYSAYDDFLDIQNDIYLA